jgi:predicted nucleic acid-binding protein
MIVLDTNVISEFTRPVPNLRVEAWLRGQSPANLATTTVTEAEIFGGLVVMPDGKRKTALIREAQTLLGVFADRIFPFDRDAAQIYPLIVLQRKVLGHTTAIADGQIAAIARLHGATIATRNTTHFADSGIELINPWTA